MKTLAQIVMVVGFCVGALGAAGFHAPNRSEQPPEPAASDARTTETLAWPLFLAGVAGLLLGAVMSKASARNAGGESGGSTEGGIGSYRKQVEDIRDIVAELDAKKEELAGVELRDRIGDLLSQEFFDLTTRSNDLIAHVGFNAYARVWDGVAAAERLLGRAWSMATDGSIEEGREELPLARAHLDRAADLFADL